MIPFIMGVITGVVPTLAGVFLALRCSQAWNRQDNDG